MEISTYVGYVDELDVYDIYRLFFNKTYLVCFVAGF